MSIQTATPTSPGSTVKPYRLTVRQFLKAIEAGVFPSDVKLELLGGVLVEKMTTNPAHNSTVIRLGMSLRDILPREWFVSEEKPIDAGTRWRPIPDLSLIRGPVTEYIEVDPKGVDVGVVIEVSDTTYSEDRGSKWRRYAAAKLDQYWIVNINAKHVEFYASPIGRGKAARYRSLKTYKKGESIPVVIGEHELGRIAVNDFMP